MVKLSQCSVSGCEARAWHGELCNLHALERYRGKRRRPTEERLAEGKRLLRQRARDLGIVLADDPPREPAPEPVPVSAGAHPGVGRKVRSPVA